MLLLVSARFFESTRHSGATVGDVPFGFPIIGIPGAIQSTAHLAGPKKPTKHDLEYNARNLL